MAGTSTLSENQLQAIAYLAEGVTQGVTAERVGVTRKTISSWLRNSPQFVAELQAEKRRREERTREKYQEAADQIQDEAVKEFQNEIKEFQRSLLAAYKQRINRGLKILQKVGRRFDDLPEEAITMKEIASLIQAGDRLIEKGFEQWADSLAVSELMDKLRDGD